MADLEERFRSLARTPAPDLWPEVDAREPRNVTGPAAGGRVVAAAVAFAVALTGIGFAVGAFTGEKDLRQPATTVSNGLLAFASGGDVWVVHPDGSGLTNVTNTRRPHDAPDGCTYEVPREWSPDGSRLALYGSCDPPGSDGGANYDVFVMNADGSGRENLTTSPEDVESGASQLNPHWSPDGTQIAFDGDDGLYVVGVDGSGLQKIADGGLSSWSPDGTKVAFVGDGGIHTADADGSNPALLMGEPGFEDLPAWSPAGDLISFVAPLDVEGHQLEVVHPQGGGRRRLTDLPNDGMGGYSPSWSPDGERIAIEVHEPGGSWDLYVVNADGSGVTQLTNGPGDENRPTWSPDGTQIAFMGSPTSGGNNSGTFDVYTVDPDGTNLTQITDGSGAAPGALTWQPVLADERPSPSPTTEAAPLNPRVAAKIQVGAFPRAVAVGEGAVWASVDNANGGPDDHLLLQIDPVTNEIVETIPVAEVGDITIGAGALWMTSWEGGESVLLRIDPGTGEVEATIPLGPNASNVEFGFGAVWVTVTTDGNRPAGEVIQIDPVTNQIVARVRIDEGWPRDIVMGEGSVWVYGHSKLEEHGWVASSLWRIDPLTNELAAVILDQNGFLGDGSYLPDNVAVGEGWVWAGDDRGNGVRIDPATGVSTTFELPDSGFAWPFLAYEGSIFFGLDPVRILDMETLEVVGSIALESQVADAALDDSTGTLWIANYEGLVTRIELH